MTDGVRGPVGRRRRTKDQRLPVWFGVPFAATGLFTSALALAGPRGGQQLAILGLGIFFALIGAALVWTAIRERSLARGRPPQAAALNIGAYDVARFTRSPMRILMDLVLAPIGGVAFLGLAVFVFVSMPMGFLVAILPVFFGIILLLGGAVTVRRGIGFTIVEVGPQGIRVPDAGRRLGWNEIDELRIEDAVGVGGPDSASTATYRRLGIVPRDPELARRAPGRMATGMIRGFTRFVNTMRPNAAMSDPAALAPFGVSAYEIEQPFEQLLRSIQRFAPVRGAEALTPAGGASDAAIVGETLTPVALPAAPPLIPLGALRLVEETPAPAADPGPSQTFRHRSSIPGVAVIGDIGGVASWIVLPLIFLVIFPATFFGPGTPVWVTLFTLALLLIPLYFLLAGIGQALRIPARRRVRSGPAEVLTVDAAGIDMRGMGRLSWSEIGEIRAVDSGRPTGESSPAIPRLEIVPRDESRLAQRPWSDRAYDTYRTFLRRLKPFGDPRPIAPSFGLDFDLLDASADEVLDLIARYRVVDDAT